ncbi:MAG: type IV toxin-antitoxin system AbiEi family antitoxin domain-containing protein [Nocardiaceae bacterium]|nr:type IV toxin-antitoxin system AbiEi family antitoxin domain-containing protein [Nocardiaceae bacterium]
MAQDSSASIVAEICADQWGFVTTSQARSAGLTAHQVKRLADRGALERMHYGIYRMTRLPDDPHTNTRLAWIALDPATPAWQRLEEEVPTGVLSHQSAANLYGLGDIRSDYIEISALKRIRIKDLDIHIHITQLRRDDWEIVDGIPVTTVARTIADLAAERIDGGHLASIVRDALERDLITTAQVETILAPHAFNYGHPLNDGAALLKHLIAESGVSDNVVKLADLSRTGVYVNPETLQALTANLDTMAITRALAAVDMTDAVKQLVNTINTLDMNTAIKNMNSTYAALDIAKTIKKIQDASAALDTTATIRAIAESANTASQMTEAMKRIADSSARLKTTAITASGRPPASSARRPARKSESR